MSAPAYPSPNFGNRRYDVRPTLVVLHYTGMDSHDAALARLCDPAAEVSAHYLIGMDGTVIALVDEAHRAWHAGAGAWGAITDVNSHSIGIEITNPGNQPFAERQMAALEVLLAGVMARWSILPQGVIAHSDMAPMRKRDPGPRFDWRRLALAGLSVWPDEVDPVPDLDEMLVFMGHAARFGYDRDASPAFVRRAFRARFRPAYVDRGGVEGIDGAIMANLADRFPVDANPPSA